MAVRSLSGVRASEVNPSFLHANSTSHTWIFSAIAELIDNAYDPDVAATQLWIEKRMINGQVTLVFVDNGNGMNPDRLHKMLSFGFSEKQEVRGHRPIGQYGNGFKSGSMRLGKDVLVFTRQRGTMSVGFLSQTYLQSINAKTVFVPIVTWRLPSKQIVQSAECYASLKEILRHSIFRTERSIIQELDALGCIGHSGTEIIIYNLKRDRRGNLELDFESDPNDILNPQTLELDRSMMFRNVAEPTPAFRRSLREYCSILYLKPRMKIMLRGEKVKTKLVSRSLSRTEKDVYKPHFLPRPVKIIFGFSPTKGEDYGIMMYHKNRLIIAYEKVGYQKQANELGVGVVGVVELNFLEPIHNKQDFNKTIQYNSCVNALGVKLNEYWNEKTKGVTPGNRMIGPGSRPPDWLWAQCDKCLKWRRLPPTISENQLPKKWFCHMNHDATRNRCDIPEEAEDDDDVVMRPSYEKTYKKQMEERKRLQRIEQLRQMQNREKQLQMREEELKRMKSSLSAQNNSPAASNPSSQPGGSGSSTPSSGQVFPTGSITPNTSVQTPATADADADVKPTEAELLRAQQELSEAKRQETQQTKLIEQLQQQKDLLELKKKDVLKMAESLTMKQLQETEKNGSGETLSFGGGVKRGLEEDKEESENKRVRVVTSDGEVVYVVQRDEAPKPLIDLTMSDDEEAAAPEPQEKPSEPASEPPPTINNEPPAEEERDIKPDLDELDRRIAEAQRALGMVDEAPADANNAAETTTNMESSTGETTAASEETPNAASAEVNGVDRETADIPPVTKFEAPSEDSNAESDRALESRNSNANSETAAENLTNGITDAAVSSADKSQSNKESVEAPMETEGENGEKNTEEGTGQKKDSAADNVSASDKVSPVDNGNVAEEDMDDDDFGGDFGDDFEDDDDFLRETETPESNAEKTADGQTNGSVSENKDSTVPTENSSEAKDKETSDKSISPPPEKADAKEEDKKDSEEKVDVKEDSDVKKETKPDLPLDSGDIKSETKPKLSKVLKTRGMQTLPVEMKSMLPDSYNFSKLTPCEIHHLLVQRTNELEGLRKNVRELLRIILPEVDLGTPDSIDQVVQEVIRVNQTSESSSEPDPTPPPP